MSRFWKTVGSQTGHIRSLASIHAYRLRSRQGCDQHRKTRPVASRVTTVRLGPVVRVDERFDYGEQRYQAFGRSDGKAHCLVFTFTDMGIRAISFCRAHEKELRRYE
ncbi:BrnT family toxin [Sphingomonas sp. M6A6_1c]|uniref:BrnT family toxin n=1 Tax=Sphingomonas sp. CD22 TaxID=3100214 RepID=UPI003A0FF6FB